MKKIFILFVVMVGGLNAQLAIDWNHAWRAEVNSKCAVMINWLRVEKDEETRQKIYNDLYTSFFVSWVLGEKGLFKEGIRKNKPPHQWMEQALFKDVFFEESFRNNPLSISNFERFKKERRRYAELFENNEEYKKLAVAFSKKTNLGQPEK